MTFCLVQSEGAKKKSAKTNATRKSTPLKFNSSPLKNGALKTTFQNFAGNFSGANSLLNFGGYATSSCRKNRRNAARVFIFDPKVVAQ